MWSCKGCTETVSSRSKLLHHYRLKHPHFGRRSHFPCTYLHCPCTFKTWNALIVHQNKIHSTGVTTKKKAIFSCHLCECNDLASERDYFAHIYAHLKRNETLTCMFLGCNFKTNIYCTFKSHKNCKHRHYTPGDFKRGIVRTGIAPTNEFAENSQEFVDQLDTVIPSHGQCDTEYLQKVIEQSFANTLLKLEHLVHVPSTAIDVFLEELYHLIRSAPVPLSCDIVTNIFNQRNLPIDKDLITETINAVFSGNPVLRSIQKGGPLSTAYLRKQYYKENFCVLEPVEYILDAEKKHSFQYVPLLKLLQQLLSRKDVVDEVVKCHKQQVGTDYWVISLQVFK